MDRAILQVRTSDATGAKGSRQAGDYTSQLVYSGSVLTQADKRSLLKISYAVARVCWCGLPVQLQPKVNLP